MTLTYRRLRNTRGFTILEVLIAAAIFMISFSLLVFLLNQMITGFSIKELVLAYHLASDTMQLTLAKNDFSDQKILEIKSAKTFIVERKVSRQGNYCKIRINVYRSSGNRLLATLYNEISAP
jgi:prepilin-type N-terminal cleavage/methylation domain-containing protein